MECNKDEAVRAKEIAEKKFMGRDYAGAKKFALKAQSLYPELEGLSQMLSAFDVYISAENRISSGEVDWYCVLGVNRWADNETVRKRYRKLALMLHPDKNKSLGADGAFKLVSEAWGLLSDKKRRLEYNQKLNPAGPQQRVSTHTKVPSAQHSANGFHDHNNTATSHTRTRNKNMQSRPTSVPSPSSQKSNMFWTICNLCMKCYAYHRIFLNCKLLCPNCHQPFMAVEKDLPSNIMKSSQNSRHHAGGKVASTSTAGHAESVVQKAYDQVKREQEDAQAATEWEEHYASKRMDGSALRVEQFFKKRRLRRN
ncbi:unnamed protein product [Dovyalis caffra]|uniref:J domain-containing protein n=1 Tax=Dovyalis caffra TaxID=77055 RepID=A0AAV1QUB0_9ROSI|nr:unnamed protein product [Dovyalis caffra]